MDAVGIGNIGVAAAGYRSKPFLLTRGVLLTIVSVCGRTNTNRTAPGTLVPGSPLFPSRSNPTPALAKLNLTNSPVYRATGFIAISRNSPSGWSRSSLRAVCARAFKFFLCLPDALQHLNRHAAFVTLQNPICGQAGAYLGYLTDPTLGQAATIYDGIPSFVA